MFLRAKKTLINNFEDFKKVLASLSKEQQVEVLEKLYDMIYDQADASIWRTMATAIKYGKDESLEGHEDFQIKIEDLKRLSHIQDGSHKRRRMTKK
ncbi:MAG: hypothetical protein KDK66_03810 [Deltaproteobacteria bacterium]|nr:hypothetical protein [Deltaproteobacteria bacterium]